MCRSSQLRFPHDAVSDFFAWYFFPPFLNLISVSSVYKTFPFPVGSSILMSKGLGCGNVWSFVVHQILQANFGRAFPNGFASSGCTLFRMLTNLATPLRCIASQTSIIHAFATFGGTPWIRISLSPSQETYEDIMLYSEPNVILENKLVGTPVKDNIKDSH